MKVNLEVDCTPEEARRFFGLPDLGPVHEAYIERMTRFAQEGMSAGDLEQAMRGWMGGISGLADLQQALFSAMTAGAGTSSKND